MGIKNENWAPGMKEGLKQAENSGKEDQKRIDELAKNQYSEDGVENFVKKDYTGGGFNIPTNTD